MQYSRLVIIYKADGGLLGELSYVVKKVAGLDSCTLCDITHTLRGQKSEWKAACARLPVEVEALHRDEIRGEVLRAAGGRFPCVVGVGDNGVQRIVEPAEIDVLGGDVAAFERLLRSRLA